MIENLYHVKIKFKIDIYHLNSNYNLYKITTTLRPQHKLYETTTTILFTSSSESES